MMNTRQVFKINKELKLYLKLDWDQLFYWKIIQVSF